MSTDPRVDAYIAKAADFARPMLQKLRADIHSICPGAEETIKWGAPSFSHQGRNLCGIAAFKAHVACFVHGGAKPEGGAGMGEFGKMQSMTDLPSKAALAKPLKARMKIIEAGPAGKPTAVKPPPEVPPDLAKALKASKPAAATFKALPPSGQRDYVTWITEAKRAETRAQRVAQAAEWLAEGKPRNWKYMAKK